MHEALIVPSRGVAIFIHPYEIVIWQLMSLAMTKLPRPIFFWKLSQIGQNYAVANGITPASAQNTSHLHFLHKIINTIVCYRLPNNLSQIFKSNKTLIILMKLIFEICIIYNPCKSHLLWGKRYATIWFSRHVRPKWCRKPEHSGWGLDGVMKKGSNECEYMGWVMGMSW